MDRIGYSAKRGLDFIKSRAMETVEVQKLSSELKQLEERRQNCLLEIAYRVLAAYGTEQMTDATFRDRVEEAQALDAQIEELKSRQEDTKEHLKQSVGEILPRRPGSTFKGPDYE